MIATRKEAIFLIGMHLVPNIFGVARFSYGFHRTASGQGGLVLDIWLGAESVTNVCTDVVMILLLWREESTAAPPDSRHPVLMTRLLGAFVVWNTLALMCCCCGNLVGLRYPPKWMKIVIFWAPLIIGVAFAKVHYTGLLYQFYRIYKKTSGKAYDGEGLAEMACSGRASRAPTPSVPTAAEGRTPAGLSPLHPHGVPLPTAAAETPLTAVQTPSGPSPSSVTPQDGGTAVASAMASSSATPQPQTADGSAAVTPRSIVQTPTKPRVAAERDLAVTVDSEAKCRPPASGRSKKQPTTADGRNAGGKATATKSPAERTRPL
ncbi:uncharacterized protein [Dermacentor albipictus]|uniref:uncharacterized protein isoform X2 n=1 Tax=Dermacentor albipictus TaxID=60249 RepID=UPI0031FD8729